MKRSLCLAVFLVCGCLFAASRVMPGAVAASDASGPAERPSLSISEGAYPDSTILYGLLRPDISGPSGSVSSPGDGADDSPLMVPFQTPSPSLSPSPSLAPSPSPSRTPYPTLGPTPTLRPYPTVTPSSPYPSPTAPPGTPPSRPTARPTKKPELTATVTPAGQPHLVLSQSVPAKTPSPGEEVAVRIVVTNDGTVAAHDVVLALQMPASLEVRDVAIWPAGASEWQGNILWVAWGYLEAGAVASVEVRALVSSAGPGSTEIIATVPDYGLETRAILAGPPQVLPATGPGTTPWWGWLALAGALVAGGLLLLQYVRRDGPEDAGRAR